MKYVLTRHAFAYLLSHGVPAMIGFLGIAVYSRLLSPEEYGRYALVFAVAAMVNAVLFEWLKVSVLRLSKNDVQKDVFYMTVKASFVGLMSVSLALATVFFLVSNWIPWPLLVLTLFLTWGQSWYQLNLSLLRAELNPLRYGRIAFARAVLGLVLAVSFIAAGFAEIGLLVGLILGLAFSVAPLSVKRWGFKLSRSKISKPLLKQFASYGLPLTITMLLGMIIHQSDRIIISSMLGVESTGMYAITYDLTEQSIFTLMLIVNLAAFPLAVKALEEHGETAAHKQVKANTGMLLAIGMPMLVGLILTRESVAYLFLGEPFRDTAVTLIPYIAVGALLKGFKLYGIDILFHLTKQTKLQIVPVVVAAFANVVLTIVLIPVYGLEGAALATVVAYALSIALSWFIVHKQMTRLPFPFKEFVKILCATAVMATTIWPFLGGEGLSSFVIQVLVGISSYGLVYGLFHYEQLLMLLKRSRKKENCK